MVGLALLAFGAAFLGSGVYARRAQLDELQQEAEAMRGRYRIALSQPEAGDRSTEQQLRTFHEFFPPVSALPDWLERIYATGRAAGIAIELGEYRLMQEQGRQLVRYQMTLPLKGTYAQIRRFIAQVLEDVPALALDDIDLKRQAIHNTALEARVRLTLFLESRQP
jgi:Tfp pilus assembly protein PilO